MEPNTYFEPASSSSSSSQGYTSYQEPVAPQLPQVALLVNVRSSVLQQYGWLNNILKQQLQVKDHQLHLTNPQAIWNLAEEENTLYAHMEEQMRALVALPQRTMLTPYDLADVRELKTDLRKQMKQLELYREELRHVQNGTAPSAPLASLVIIKQPLPLVIRKTKQLSEDELAVQLLTGAYNDLGTMRYSGEGRNLPHITASLLLDNGAAGNVSFLDGNTQPIDPATGIARFPLRFPKGTRKSIGYLKFGMSLGLSAVESEMSDPLIIITNECQWENSIGTLIKKDAFGGRLEISWELFANTLQLYFLVATKQDIRHPKRPLSGFDFTYLHSKFFASHTITQSAFDKFWNWFGKIVHPLRFQKHICPLWQAGIVYGFLDRESVEKLLVVNRQVPGTFIIRFSERHAGQFDIVWVGANAEINHYLVKPEDISGTRRTLPDFISQCHQFMYLMQLNIREDGTPTSFVTVPKDAALQNFVAQRPPVPLEDSGYKPLEL